MNTNNNDDCNFTEQLKDQLLAERLKRQLDNLVADSNRHDELEKKKSSDILGMIKDKGNDDFKHTCETIIRRQQETSSLIGEVIDGSMPDPSDWDRLSDTVDEMDLLMRRLQRQIGDPR